MSKHFVVSRHNLTNCPSCMSHITPTSQDSLTCPFCEATISFQRGESLPSSFGHEVMNALKSSRSAALAAMLGASLSMASCTPAEPEEDMASESDMMDEPDMPMNQALYGVPAIDMGARQDEGMPAEPDMPMDQPLYGAPAMDMDEPAPDMPMVEPAYGVPPEDMG